MELVPNSQQLRAAWPSLSILGELKVILTMRLYLRQLRRVQHTSSNNLPGPLGPKPLPCNGLQFGFDPKRSIPDDWRPHEYFQRTQVCFIPLLYESDTFSKLNTPLCFGVYPLDFYAQHAQLAARRPPCAMGR